MKALSSVGFPAFSKWTSCYWHISVFPIQFLWIFQPRFCNKLSPLNHWWRKFCFRKATGLVGLTSTHTHREREAGAARVSFIINDVKEKKSTKSKDSWIYTFIAERRNIGRQGIAMRCQNDLSTELYCCLLMGSYELNINIESIYFQLTYLATKATIWLDQELYWTELYTHKFLSHGNSPGWRS